MRAYEIQKFGLHGLKMEQRSKPTPGARQVLVAIRACSLNYRDLLTILGHYNPRQPLPLIPMSDGVGVVEQIGEQVQDIKVGDRVAGIFAQKWLAGPFTPQARASTLGGPLDGMLAEYAILNEQGVIKIPEYLTDTQAACLPCAGVTAYNALFETGGLRAGQTVLLLGTGGVSILALQQAKASGARCIITSSSDEKLSRAKSLGADEIINYKTHPDWEKRVREITGGRGADVVLEVGGAATLPKSISSVKFAGRIALIGVLGGVKTDLAVTSILMKQVRVQGVFVGSKEMFQKLNDLISLHEIRPVVDKVFEFDEVHKAFEHMQKGSHFGKIVIRI